jgi:ankyrin repeat protein
LGLALLNGLNPSACTEKGESLLSIALLRKEWVIAEMLLQKGAQADRVEPSGTTPLLLLMGAMPSPGSLQDSLERLMVKMLGSGVKRIDHVGPDGYSALMLAVMRMEDRLIDRLLQAGARVNNPNAPRCLWDLARGVGRQALSDRLQAWAADAHLREP